MARDSRRLRPICCFLPPLPSPSSPSARGRSAGVSIDRNNQELCPVRFLSDNTATVCPEILAAMAAVNHGRVPAYGDDEWSSRLDRSFSDFFGTDVRAFVVSTGTAANALSLATLSPPYGAMFAHEEAHIVTDECGAPGFFTGGAQLVLLPGDHGRVTPDTLRTALAAHPT